MGMAENYKHLYEQTKKMLAMYQDELIPGFRKQIEELEAKSKWIPVTERLPEKEGRYLCVVRIGYKSGAVYVKVMNGDRHGFSLEHIYNDDVTHWMPLPEPPKGE